MMEDEQSIMQNNQSNKKDEYFTIRIRKRYITWITDPTSHFRNTMSFVADIFTILVILVPLLISLLFN